MYSYQLTCLLNAIFYILHLFLMPFIVILRYKCFHPAFSSSISVYYKFEKTEISSKNWLSSSTHSSYLLENSNPNNYSIITVTRFQKFTPPTGLTGLHAYLAGQSTAGTTSGYPSTQLVSGSSIIDGPHSSSPTENKRIKNILIFFKSSMMKIE